MTHEHFEAAVELINAGDVEALERLLKEHPDLAAARGEDQATLLVRLIDWPGHRPRAAETARVLVDAGVEVDGRRDEKNGTPLAGALCTEEIDVIRVLIDAGADVHAPLGWMEGTTVDMADRICLDLGRQRDQNIQTLSELFTRAAGRPVPTRAPFGGTTTMLFVADVDAGLAFYKTLGFRVDWMHQSPNCDPYICISRGGAEFHLTGCACDDKRHVGNLWVRIECDQIDDLFAECQAAEVKILDGPANYPWGFREMEVEDPDGNRITFYGPTKEEPEEESQKEEQPSGG